jgi:probable phosphomutase (TIGR03848 family)
MPRRPPAPTPTTICFVRHGQTPTTGKVLPGRAPGLHLNEAGIAQAQGAGARLATLKSIAALYTSPLERARETAAEIGKAIGKRAVVERGLLECDFGEWTGRELVGLRKLPEWKTVEQSPSAFRFPGGESFLDMRARLAAAVERLVARHPGEMIVAVSHADPIKVVVTDAIGAPLDLLQRTVISTCSVSVVTYGAGPPRVLTVNSTGELAGLGLTPAQAKGAVR